MTSWQRGNGKNYSKWGLSTNETKQFITEAQKGHAVVSSFFLQLYEETTNYLSFRHFFNFMMKRQKKSVVSSFFQFYDETTKKKCSFVIFSILWWNDKKKCSFVIFSILWRNDKKLLPNVYFCWHLLSHTI